MWKLIVLALSSISGTAQTPDYTTQVSCAGSVRVVLINTILGTECTVQGMINNQPLIVPFSSFGLTVSQSNGYVVKVNPENVSSSSFSFQIQVLQKTGHFALLNTIGAPIINFTVVTIPGPLTELVCPTRQRVNATCDCTVIPRDATGAEVWVEASKFAFSGIDKNSASMTWSAPDSDIGNRFLVRGTFPSSSIFTVSNGFSRPVVVAALDDPDSTSVLVCEPNVVPVSTITVCTIDTKKNSQSVTVLQSIFNLEGLNQGTAYSDITSDDMQLPGVGSRFSVTATIGPQSSSRPYANTGLFNFSDGISTQFPITVTADPDQTSLITCEANTIVAGGVLACTSTPKLVGVPIFCQTSLWQLSVVDKSGGSGDAVAKFSAITPLIVGDLFYWTVTPNETLLDSVNSAEIIINDGKSPQVIINVTAPLIPDVTTTMTCNRTLLRPSERTTCTIFPKLSNSPIAAKASAFKLTDTQSGSFSMLTPAAGKSLYFDYTVKSTASGTVTLSNGVGAKLVLTVSGSAPTTQPPTVPTAPTAPTSPTATLPPSAAEEGGMGATGAVILTLCIIVVLVSIFLGWSYKRKMDAAKVNPMDDNLYSPPTIN